MLAARRLLGTGYALSPWVWLLPLPLYLAVVLLVEPPVGAPEAWSIAAMATICLGAFSSGIVVALARVLLSRWLCETAVSVLIVVIVWTVAVSVSFNVTLSLQHIVTDQSPLSSPHPTMWIASLAAEHLLIAAGVAGYLSVKNLRVDALARSGSARTELTAAKLADARLSDLVHNTVESDLLPELRHLQLEVQEASEAPDAQPTLVAAIPDEILDFANSSVRPASRRIAELDVADLPSAQALADAGQQARRLTFAALARLFPRVAPVSLLVLIVIAPFLLPAIFAVQPRQTLGLLGTAGALILLLEVFRRLLRTRRYLVLAPTVQWLIWFLGLASIGALVSPLVLVTGAPSDFPFTNYSPATQGVLAAALLVVLNLALGLAVAMLRDGVTDVIDMRSRALLDESVALGRRRTFVERRRMIVSSLHGKVQGRLISLALLLSDAIDGFRPLDETVHQVNGELNSMVAESIPGLATLEPPDSSETVSLPTTQLSELISQWSRVASVELTIESDDEDSFAVTTALAERVLDLVTEALCNAVRHGGASSCQVLIDRPPNSTDSIRVVVSDNGLGVSGPQHHGLGSQVLDECTGGAWSLNCTNRGCQLTGTLR